MGHMTTEEFRRYGHALVDWIAEYWSGLAERPVTPDLAPGSIAAALPARAPETGEGLDGVIKDLDALVVPGLTHWQHPNFYAYFPANTSGPSVLGDLVCAGLGVQGMLWQTGPACTEIETVMLDWLADLLGLPDRFHSRTRGLGRPQSGSSGLGRPQSGSSGLGRPQSGTRGLGRPQSGRSGGGVIQDSASSATLVATLVALHRATGGRWRASGVDDRLRVYTSNQGHSSIEKAVRIAGLGDEAIRLVDVEPDTQAMSLAALRDAIAADRYAGLVPAMVVATIGTTSTTAIDPLPHIGELCREYGAWLHVDAAYAGAAAICPELRWTHAGVEYADSYCFDPHKWLLTGFDCDAFWVADRAELIEALSVLPEFLRNAATESGAVIDYRDWQVPLGRRFRALKLWFVLRWYGAEGLREHIRHGVALAQEFAGWVAADDRFEIVAPHPFSLVCFRLLAGDGPTEELLRRLNASGRLYLTHTKVRGAYTLRLAIGSPYTDREHVADAWRQIQDTATDVLTG